MSRNPENNRFPISARALNDSMLINISLFCVFKVRENYTANKEMTARYRHKRVIQWSQVKKHAQKIYLFIYVFFHLSVYLYIFFSWFNFSY